jgi:hypothetical protein
VARQTIHARFGACDARDTDAGYMLGPGVLTAGSLERGAEVIGLDFSVRAVELARKLVPNGHFQQGEAHGLSAASFDANR